MGTKDKGSSVDIVNEFKSRLTSRNTGVSFSSVAKPFNREAFEFFLKGKFYWEFWTKQSISKALRCFKKAIIISPDYVEAYGWLANCYCYLGITGKKPSWRAFEKAERIIQKAKAIDPAAGEIFLAQGMVDTFLYRDYTKAGKAFDQALLYDRNPHYLHLYAQFLLAVGKVEQSVECLDKALQLEPDNVLINAELAKGYYFNRQYPEALEQYEFALDLEPTFQSALKGKGWTHMVLGEYDEAHEMFEHYQNLVSHEQKNIPQLVFLSARMGMKDVALHFLDILQLGEEKVAGEVSSLDIALIYFSLDQYDDAFFHLQRAVDDYIGETLYIKSNPIWNNLKNDIRYKKLLRQMNLIKPNIL